MKLIRSWMSHHPFKVVLFTFLFTFIPAVMAVTDERLFYPGLAAFMIFTIVWAVSVWRYSKNIVTVLLIMAIMAAPMKQARGAMIGVGVIIVCVGGYCVYKVVKVCQKKFPPRETNAPPEQFTAAGGEYGGACEYASIGSCYVMPTSLNASPYENLLINPTTFTLNVVVEPAVAVTSMNVNNAEGTAQDWAGFQSEMASHGLFITGHPSQSQFEMGGVPCDPSMVPLSFDQEGRVIHLTGSDMRRVTIERSPNLVDWAPLLVTDTGVGSGFKVVDTTREGQMFYRVQVSQP